MNMRSSATPWKRILASCLLGAAVGVILITLPSLLHREHLHSVFDLLRFSVKNMSAFHLLLLVAGGVFWGLTLRWPYSFCAAVCQIACLPVVAVVEMIMDSTSHNLWPLEFLIYAVLALVPLVGVAVATLMKRLVKTTG